MGQQYEVSEVQISRAHEGPLHYAYVLTTLDHDPTPEEIVWKLTANDPDPGYKNLTVFVPNAGTNRVADSSWAICPLCAMSFPKSEMSRVKGLYYCNRNKCAEEARTR
jgi:hypothetical protein